MPSRFEHADELRATWLAASEAADTAWTAWTNARAAERAAWRAYQAEHQTALAATDAAIEAAHATA